MGELDRSVKAVLALLYENRDVPLGPAFIREGDARLAEELLAEQIGLIDVIVTSPPYATALPYLDTDRLSLCYLGLLPRPEHRQRDYDMIGNREITERQRQNYWEEYRAYHHLLPQPITGVIDLIEQRNRQANVGFRRRNLAALLGRYFLDMRQVLQTFTRLLSPRFVKLRFAIESHVYQARSSY